MHLPPRLEHLCLVLTLLYLCNFEPLGLHGLSLVFCCLCLSRLVSAFSCLLSSLSCLCLYLCLDLSSSLSLSLSLSLRLPCLVWRGVGSRLVSALSCLLSSLSCLCLYLGPFLCLCLVLSSPLSLSLSLPCACPVLCGGALGLPQGYLWATLGASLL